MCNKHNHSDDEDNLNANNMAAAGMLILAAMLLYLIYSEFANHHAMERLEILFEKDTGLQLPI